MYANNTDQFDHIHMYISERLLDFFTINFSLLQIIGMGDRDDIIVIDTCLFHAFDHRVHRF